MTSRKNYITIVIVLTGFLFIGGGVFLWQENQKAVADLNKNLPEGIRVEKSFIGENYKVVNKIDGYEFKVPDEWMGVEEIDYIVEGVEEGYKSSNLTVQGIEGIGRLAAIDHFVLEKDIDLKFWAKTFFDTFGFAGEFSEDTIGNFELVKTQENVHLGGAYVYFFKAGSTIYGVSGGSETYIRGIISSGKWQ